MLKAIYKIENLINHKVYIGQTVNPEKRWWQHCHSAKIHYDNYPIHLAIAKYGEKNFNFTILQWTEDYDNVEREMIQLYNSISPNGYNVSIGGEFVNVMIGEEHPRNTIKNDDLFKIINDLRKNKLSDREIAKKYNTTDKIVADINHGYSHRQENINYPIRIKRGLQKINKQQLDEIINMLLNTNLTYQQIADNFCLSKGAIYHINKGLTFYSKDLKYPIRKSTKE